MPCHWRAQSSIAVSADYRHWFIFNASPDIRGQIEAFRPLWPQAGTRHTPIEGIVLSDAELDHTLGLLSLREARSLRVYATAWVNAALHEWNPILRTLGAYCEVEWRRVGLEETVHLATSDGADSGLRCQAFSARSAKTPAYLGKTTDHPEASVGYRITDTHTGQTVVYMPAALDLSPAVRDRIENSACLLIDGTCWDDEELISLGVGSKTARAMGHLPIAGPGGSLEQVAALSVPRKLYTHINNTNPILIEDSPQRLAVEAHGIEVAVDGMELEI